MSDKVGCFLSRWQAPLQAALRPGYWIPGVRNFHSAKQTWEIEGSPSENLNKLIRAVEENAAQQRWTIHRVNRERCFLQIFTFTKSQWLDVTEIELQPGQESGTLANALSFSSGFFPVIIPFAPLLNVVFCWVPFLDMDLGRARLNLLCTAVGGQRTVRSHDKAN